MERLFTFFALLLFAVTALAQPTITVEHVQASPGSNVSVEVNVEDFNNVGAISLKIHYDTNILTFVDISDAPAGVNFTYNALNGAVIIGWFDATSTNPLNIGDGLLLKMNFSFSDGYSPLSFVNGENEIANNAGTPFATTIYNAGSVSSSGAILVEEFDYAEGDSLVNHGWTNHSGTGSQIVVSAGSLEYPNYASSNIGNSINIAGGSGSREDVHRTFTDRFDGAVYLSALVNVASAGTAQDYFLHVSQSTASGTSFRGRIYVKDDGAGGLQFGISKSGASIEFAPTTYSYNTTYLLVMKYEFVGDSAADDIAHLFINPDLTNGEPAPTVSNADGSDFPIGAVLIRQGGNAYSLQLDGIRVAPNWQSATVPVELTSFTASVIGNKVNLNWKTATEVNNSGFEVQRSSDAAEFTTISFVPGKGTTTEESIYSFTDDLVNAGGKYFYRLKQIDFDGTFEYSTVIYVDVTSPVNFTLEQNYPNPFNPATTINFNLPVDAKVTLRIFDAIGNEIQQVVDDNLSAGNYVYNVMLSNVSSGIYFYQLDAAGNDGSNFFSVKKMTLLK